MLRKILLLSTLISISLGYCSQTKHDTSNNNITQNVKEKTNSIDSDYENEETDDDEPDIKNISKNTSKKMDNKDIKDNINNSKKNIVNDNKNDDKKYNTKKKGSKNMENNNFNRKLFEDAENLDLSNTEDRKKLKNIEINAKIEKSKFQKDIWIINNKSNSITFEIRFKNEGKRSFYNTPVLLGLTLNTIIEGTKTRSGKEIKELIDNKSIDIKAYASYDNIIVTVNCLSKYFNDTIDLLCDLAMNAAFPEDKIKAKKEEIILELEQSKFSTAELAEEKLGSIVLDKKYQRNIDESIKKIKEYTYNDVINCYNKIFNPENAVIIVVGDIKDSIENNNVSNGELTQNDITNGFNKIYDVLLEKTNKYSNGKNPFSVSAVQATELKKYENAHVTLDNPQSCVMFALPGVSRTDKDKIAIRAVHYILGNPSLNSRLYKFVRWEKGLVYFVRTYLEELDLQSIIIGKALARSENINKVVDEIKKQIILLHDHGISQKELQDFKIEQYAKYIFPTNHSLLNFVSTLRNDGIKIENINDNINEYLNLSLDDINRALKKVFDPKKLVFVTCGTGNNSVNNSNSTENDTNKPLNNNIINITESKQEHNEKEQNKQEQNIKQNNSKIEKNQIDVQERVLENGMRVIVAHSDTKGFVNFGIGYFVGSIDDPRNIKGISHFVEHMMFKGTNNIKTGETTKYLSKYSVYNNAFTGYDYTFYTTECKKSFLELFIQMEADRMANLKLDLEEIEKERGAIIEERKMRCESDPYIRYIGEKIFKSLFLYSAYSYSVIGYMDQIQACNAGNLKEHYDKYYKPNNAFALFVGDIDIDEAEKLCNKYFGNIERGTDIKRDIPVDPETGITDKITHKSDQLTTKKICMYYKIQNSKINTLKKAFIIEIINDMLAGGVSSVMYKKLVEDKKILYNVKSYIYYLRYGASILYINTLLQENKNIYNVEKEINKLIKEFKENLLTEELFEIEKQKKIDNFDLIINNSRRFNNYMIEEILNGCSVDEIRNTKNILQSITYEEVKEVANDILDMKNQALVLYQMPEEKQNKRKNKNSKKSENTKGIKSIVKNIADKAKDNLENLKDKAKDGIEKVKEKVKEIKKNKQNES